jgi:hypothetical protein
VIGGWASIAHGVPRATLDVDLFIRPTRGNAEKLVAALSEIGLGIAKELSADEILRRHVLLFADQIRVDIFTKPWGLDDFDACWDRRKDAVFESVRIPVLGIEDLIRSKGTDREGDRVDAAALRELLRRTRERSPHG